jgi:alkanesulfonate monooxygenase SsuD/methylene tetrahydromethanopterin reductase-like flavin-dependent oxidoreductase (luciferase family)
MSAPLARGSVSLRVYPLDLDPAGVVINLQEQALLAEEAGFDGCMTSEHHGGFPNYLPNPVLAALWLLEPTARIWAAPCPLVLPLRPTSQVAEDLAWIHHRFPGRVGAGVCRGALPVDFELAGVPFDEMFSRYRAALPELAAALRGEAKGALGREPAVATLRPGDIPLVVAAQAVRSVQRAARLGLGVLFDSLQSIERTRVLTRAYHDAGGEGPCILIRRVWIGPPPAENMATQMDRFRGIATTGAMATWSADDGLLAGDTGAEVAERVHEAMAVAGCDTVNLRVFLAGMTAPLVADQIVRHGAETLPRLIRLLGR